MTIHANLPIENFYWDDDVYRPRLDGVDLDRLVECLAHIRGQFALALNGGPQRVVLVRDPLGVNKLFYAVREDGSIDVANYLLDLRKLGVPAEAIFSVPSGHITVVDTAKRETVSRAYWQPSITESEDASLQKVSRNIRATLERVFGCLAEHLSDRRVCVCLSGGLDSTLIATFAKMHFKEVVAFTYSFVEDGHAESEDAIYARRVAEHLDIELGFIPASRNTILESVTNSLAYGQDWRDFNVHCGVVNDIIGQAIARKAQEWGDGVKPLLLTGDMMNEIVADYTPVSYRGKDYYSLPRLEGGALRTFLIRGLDTGDREIGIFRHHGLDAIQAYGLAIDAYLNVPSRFLQGDAAKGMLVREVAGDILPTFILERKKVRAQIGTSQQPTGILPILVDSGRDSIWLAREWRRLMGIDDEAFLGRFIRIGIYRVAPANYLAGRNVKNGYYTG